MTNIGYEEILNIFIARNYDEKKKEELIGKYGSIDNAIIKLTDEKPYEEIEKLEQFLYREITDGDVVYALERLMARRRMKDSRESMRKSATRAWVAALFSAVSAVAALIVAICMVFGYKGCLKEPIVTEQRVINSLR